MSSNLLRDEECSESFSESTLIDALHINLDVEHGEGRARKMTFGFGLSCPRPRGGVRGTEAAESGWRGYTVAFIFKAVFSVIVT